MSAIYKDGQWYGVLNIPEMIANKFSKGDLYSTDEKMIGQWIDRKPLYQKTVTFNNPVFDSNKQYYYALTGLSIDFGHIVGGVHIGPDYVSRSLDILDQYKITTYGLQNYLSPVPNTIYLQSSDGTALNRTFYITIQYTKTTDSAISIGSDTDYSTEEKIIGTWIDGKPLYQRTYTYNEPVVIGATTWTTFNDISATDIENLVNCVAITTGGSCWACGGSCDSTYVGIYNYRNTGLGVIALTIQYTKTTD